MELVYYFISKDFKKTHKCRITAVPKPLAYYMSYHFAVAKNSPYTELIDQRYHINFWKKRNIVIIWLLITCFI